MWYVLRKKLLTVALDVPTKIPQEYPLSASLCIQDPGEEQKQLSQSRKKATCRRLTSDSCSQQQQIAYLELKARSTGFKGPVLQGKYNLY
ncbi:hypothetical protein AV530_006963 [Patagioenas fasciata monilis]|uniref:Uncharacterized protein n=1 Tax=Patagioenas fasciata monilis TaxID=372326 RepID=A0A1V4KZ40_PATFA|nr:hypothetical protein AV530_006963 [Patagioenas fasciata monilis]